jgi:hypothetical protein
MQAILDKAIEEYRRRTFLEGLAGDFAALRADPKAWAEEQAERRLWDNALMDDLDEKESMPARSERRRRKKR